MIKLEEKWREDTCGFGKDAMCRSLMGHGGKEIAFASVYGTAKGDFTCEVVIQFVGLNAIDTGGGIRFDTQKNAKRWCTRSLKAIKALFEFAAEEGESNG